MGHIVDVFSEFSKTMSDFKQFGEAVKFHDHVKI